MPELVDVEIVRRHLQRWTRGATIVDVDLDAAGGRTTALCPRCQA